ncbi:hypothetical protein A2313_00265 [Candidatus Roizmanbacteria bacterium RIFOXYB2_FULL_41_10]|uniref:MIP18 family-like domain-containing protein n=1 Tax=Candidatus Roizmanbacteria bacterium RIFOXYA1_FULL_41_12 TaxID=1802082 RepID=A0A1F7KAN9_9BACT|nr:MAG: hypothetical protein A2262_01255 [Candidatus Roizmanbacteria bacterium RIFOXYA2_FULL_41_8]OGK64920.1 MAG: hypothetical protein A2209_04455 [Candidatus Roizmanbacteria bacterium RIFOXYA1_FULL_41_12]OGK66819.1 MAG: hypothetical protein A2377_02870 [Candidatus Roizmanbacteria bacterium RIFOXYB1_FULL_41_27]OGK70807.1 MAG: hypothetical protein A2403_01835 [Candidatus Roizmanbacteria bacterium RIFOXYC1_FULL_41_16]OGK71401.1 MAG: hypothetical protein A2313_00265 [Candidatus Roizmanbacteria bac
MTLLEKQVWQKLAEIPDPELNISIVDLGLIYKVKIKDGQAKITMTLTTIGCPLFGTIQKSIENKVSELKQIDNVKIDLTFKPAWSMDRMSQDAKIKLGLI